MGPIGAIAPMKPTKQTLFTIVLHNLENNIRDIMLVYRPLFCHSSVTKYTSPFIQYRSCYET